VYGKRAARSSVRLRNVVVARVVVRRIGHRRAFGFLVPIVLRRLAARGQLRLFHGLLLSFAGAQLIASLPLMDEREPDDDDDAAPRAAFGRRIARGITQHQATSCPVQFDPQGVRYRCPP
jgi:hypothetical protein